MFAELIRDRLLKHTGAIMTPNVYNQVFTMHGTVMVWLVMIPLVTGAFGNFVMPLQIGARDVAFPWLNMVSFWMFPPAGLILLIVVLLGCARRGLDGVSADLAAGAVRHVDVVHGDLPRRDQLDADRA